MFFFQFTMKSIEIQEKSGFLLNFLATLLLNIVNFSLTEVTVDQKKNHSFLIGNKRAKVVCEVSFLVQNKLLNFWSFGPSRSNNK